MDLSRIPSLRATAARATLIAAVAAMTSLAVHAQSATTSPSPTAPRPDALAQCPEVMTQLEELLASATRAIGDDGEVRARFEVDQAGRVRSIAVDGHRRYALRTRLALESLNCRGGIAQGYRLTIRFAPDAPGRPASPGLAAVLERSP